MELTTVLGCIVGVAAVVGAMFFKGISFDVFINPAALLIIFVGTVATILNAFPMKDVSKLGALFKILFTTGKDSGNEKELIETIMRLAGKGRKEGLLSLEADVNAMTDPFMSKAFKLIIDGAEGEYVLEVLSSEIEAMEERHGNYANIFAQAGMYAPTLGVLGAVFGLIAAMSHIDEVEEMSHAISAAFIATILGIFTGYVLWNPFANKLKVKSKHEAFEKTLIIEGVLSIQKGEPPVRIKEKLVSLLPAGDREKYADVGGEGAK